MANTGRIQLRSDLLDWEPNSAPKSSTSSLNPHRTSSSSAYAPGLSSRALDASLSSSTSSASSYMEPMRAPTSSYPPNYMRSTAPGPNPRNLLSSSSQSSMAYSENAPGYTAPKPRLRRQPSVLQPERVSFFFLFFAVQHILIVIYFFN
jgi:hypothetical protein